MAFHGKVALVTGGASGMGKVSALRLAAAGAQVAIFDMNEAALAETAAQSPNIRAWRVRSGRRSSSASCAPSPPASACSGPSSSSTTPAAS